MPHIHTAAGQHDFTVSAYIVRTEGDEPKILLHTHKTLGKFMQFGGHVETNENLWEALTHEVLEESGYEMNQLNVLQPPHRMGQSQINQVNDARIHPVPVSILTHQFGKENHYHIDIAYAFSTEFPPANTPHDNETGDLTLFSLARLRQLGSDDIPQNVKEVCLTVMETVLSNWEPVPASDFT